MKKNQNKNYIKEFVKNNGLRIGVPFGVEDYRKNIWKCYIEESFDLCLIGDKAFNADRLLLGLLKGEYNISLNKISDIGEILGVEINVPFKVKEVEFINAPIVDTYTLTENGLINSKGKPASDCLMKLSTGEYVIVEED